LTEYRVALDVYNGPLDLLLFLIRREEVDIHDIPIARITEQFVQYVELLRQLDPDGVSEFLVLAATLMEIKSRTLLPRPPMEEAGEEMVDPRLELVRQLLEYKKFKDAARYLDDAAAERAKRHGRSLVLVPLPSDEIEVEDIDIWDLCDAFSRLLEQTGQREAVQHIGIDDTPVALHAADILDALERAGGMQSFTEIFLGRRKPEMIGLFLALLELIRRRRVRASQDRPFGTIWLHLLDPTPLDEEEDWDEEIEEEMPEREIDTLAPDGDDAEVNIEPVRTSVEVAPVRTPDAESTTAESGGDVESVDSYESRTDRPEQLEMDDEAQPTNE
jgi:segregation and condensation protein A